MHWISFALALLPVLGFSSGVATPLTSFCYTTLGTSSVASIPTVLTSETYTTSFTVTSVTTPTSTITPHSKKVVVVETSYTTTTTNAAGKTKSFTITSTQFEYDVTVAVAQFTDTTTSTSTSTVVFTPTASVPAGFTALGDAISALGYVANTAALPGDLPVQKRQDHSSSGPAGQSSAPPTPTAQPTPSIPIGVVCNEILEVAATSTITHTARAKTITAAAGTITSTSTRLITKTSTIKPKSPEVIVRTVLTVTFPITSTYSTTSTSTISTTTTTFSTAPTLFPACAGNNYVTGVSGNEVWGLGFEEGSSGTFWFGFSGYTPESCCVACWLTDTCGAAWWEGNIGGITTASGSCVGVTNDPTSCSTSQIAAQFGTYGPGSCAVPVMLMNSNCGQWEYEGLDWRGPNSIGTVPSACGF